MTPIQRALLTIAAFIGLTLDLFVWFLANRDKSKTQPIGALPQVGPQSTSHFILPNKLRGLGQRPSLAPISRGTVT